MPKIDKFICFTKKLQKKALFFTQWTDYISISFTKKNDFVNSILSLKIDSDNSNFGYIENETVLLSVQKVNIPTWVWYIFSTSVITWDQYSLSVPLWIVKMHADYVKWESLGCIHLYGLFFRLQQKKYIPYSLYEYIIDWYFFLTRLDYRFDFFYKKSENFPIPKFTFVRKNSIVKTHSAWHQVNAYTTGTPAFIEYQIYNKILDIKVKNKHYLYTDYLPYNVYRFEVRIWPWFIAWYDQRLENLDFFIQKIVEKFWFPISIELPSRTKTEPEINQVRHYQMARAYIRNSLKCGVPREELLRIINENEKS